MIKLILIIIILVLLCLTISYENFTTEFVDIDACNFIPWGPNQKTCIKKCGNSDIRDLYDETKLYCTKDKCTDICNCDDPKNKDLCQWKLYEEKEDPVKSSMKLTCDNSGSEDIYIKVSSNPISDSEQQIKYFIKYKNERSNAIHIIDVEQEDGGSDYIYKFTINNDNDDYNPRKNLQTGEQYTFIVYGLLDATKKIIKSDIMPLKL